MKTLADIELNDKPKRKFQRDMIMLVVLILAAWLCLEFLFGRFQKSAVPPAKPMQYWLVTVEWLNAKDQTQETTFRMKSTSLGRWYLSTNGMQKFIVDRKGKGGVLVGAWPISKEEYER